MSGTIVTDAVAQLVEAISAVNELNDRAIYLYTQEDLANWEKQIRTPCAGVVYVGMRAKEEAGRRGVMADLLCDVFLVVGGEMAVSTDESKALATKYLDDFRAEIWKARSPSGHVWSFVLEGPAPMNVGHGAPVMGYVQRWSTAVSLVR